MGEDTEKLPAELAAQEPSHQHGSGLEPIRTARSKDVERKTEDFENSDSEDQEAGPPLENTKSNVSRAPTISKQRGAVFMVAIVLTQLVQMIPYGAGINGSLVIGHAIGADDARSAWIAASYPLTQGSFVLISGRLGSVYGHKFMLTLGASVWIFWTLATAYGQNIVGVSFMRGLAGIGGGLMVPNAVALLTITFPPGKQRNISLALFGAMAPVGAAGGGVIAGIFLQWTEWTWLFFFLAMLGLVVYGLAILSVPADETIDPDGKVDWLGSYLGVAGLILFNFVWNQAPAAGWDNPYEYVLLIVAILRFAAFIIWEAKYATSPVLPFDIWKAPSFGPLMVTIFFAFMGLGIYIWYVAVFLQNIRGWDPVLEGCAFIPLAICGCGVAFLAAWLVPRLRAEIIVAIGCVATATINVLLATTPRHQTYWAMIFPAMIVSAFTADLLFAASQIITSSVVPRRHQGAAGSLIGTLLTYGLSTGLGFAGTVEVYTNKGGADLLRGYRGAAYLGIGLAGAALAIDLLFVRMKKNNVEGWQGEDADAEP